MNEQQLYTKRLKPWLDDLVKAGAPLWYRKIHGSAFQRDIPDILFMVGGELACHGAVELKHPEKPTAATPGQRRELAKIAKAGGYTLVSHDEWEVKRFFALRLEAAGWYDSLIASESHRYFSSSHMRGADYEDEDT